MIGIILALSPVIIAAFVQALNDPNFNTLPRGCEKKLTWVQQWKFRFGLPI